MVHVVKTEVFEVPSHVEEQADAQLHRLDVAHVEQPVAVAARAVGLLQLLVHQHGRRGAKPKVVVRAAQIREVVIHARPAAALLFFRVAKPFQVAVIVIRPHQRDLVRHGQPALVQIKGFLVRHENLRDVRQRLLDVFRQDAALVGDGLLQHLHLLILRQVTLHARVVQAAHGQRINILVGRSLAHPVVQLLQDGLTVF